MRAALRWGQSAYGRTLLVEAGSRTTRPLYEGEDGGALVDAVALGEYSGPVPPSALGPASISSDFLERVLGAAALARGPPVREGAGTWQFSMWGPRSPPARTEGGRSGSG